MNEDLNALIEAAVQKYHNMTADERRAMLREQARSFARSIFIMSSDPDEAAFRQALATGDVDTIDRLDAEGVQRGKIFDETWAAMYGNEGPKP